MKCEVKVRVINMNVFETLFALICDIKLSTLYFFVSVINISCTHLALNECTSYSINDITTCQYQICKHGTTSPGGLEPPSFRLTA